MSQTDATRLEPLQRTLDANLEPAHAWVLGLLVERDGSVAGPGLAAWAIGAECTCPEYCERDHSNE